MQHLGFPAGGPPALWLTFCLAALCLHVPSAWTFFPALLTRGSPGFRASTMSPVSPGLAERGAWGWGALRAAVAEHTGKCVCGEGLQRMLFLNSLLENVWGQDTHWSPSPLETG